MILTRMVSGLGLIKFHPALVIDAPTSQIMKSMKKVTMAEAIATATPIKGASAFPKSKELLISLMSGIELPDEEAPECT